MYPPPPPPPGQYGLPYGQPGSPTGRVRPPGLTGPAVGLIITGTLAFLSWAIYLGLGLMDVRDSMTQEVSDTAGQAGYIIGSAFPIVGVVLAPFTVLAGVQMLRGATRGFVLFGTYASLVPCTLCCLLGLPFAIWALVVLMRDDVKAYFRQPS